jgi:hypothetical protein
VNTSCNLLQRREEEVELQLQLTLVPCFVLLQQLQ